MWLQHTTLDERRALIAAYAGYGLDGFDFMTYSFIIPTLISVWGLSKAQAGYRLLSDEIEIGAGGRLHFLVDPSATHGVLLEICQDPISAV